MSAPPGGYAPRTLGLEEMGLLGEISRAIRQHPEAFRPGGRFLDEQFSQLRARAAAVRRLRSMRSESHERIQLHRALALLFARPKSAEQQVAEELRCERSTLNEARLWHIALDFVRGQKAPLDVDTFSVHAIQRGVVVPQWLLDVLKTAQEPSSRSARGKVVELVRELVPWRYEPIVVDYRTRWRQNLELEETPWVRLQCATAELAQREPPYEPEVALAICVLAWIQWDSEAHTSDLKLCEFEALPWKWEYRAGEPLDGRQMGTAIQPRHGGGAIIAAARDAMSYLKGIGQWPPLEPAAAPHPSIPGRAVPASSDADPGAKPRSLQKSRRGRPPQYDDAKDRKLFSDWKSSGLRREEYERERGLDEGAIRAAYDRTRAGRRRSREGD